MHKVTQRLLIIAVCVSVVACSAADPVESTEQYSVAGWPQYNAAQHNAVQLQLLINEGYVVGYSAVHKQPLWVAYRLLDTDQYRGLKRPEWFNADHRVDRPVRYYEYSRSGYTRGHLAPSYAIGRSYGTKAQHETFFMTNISPQLATFNGKWWQRLEEVVYSHFTRRLNEVWVVTGPVFDENEETLGYGIAVPDAFYKIVLAKKFSGDWIVLAFLVPQTAPATAPLSAYQVSVDRIEEQTGLDFFTQWSQSQQALMEQEAVQDDLWSLPSVDNLPPRY